MGPLHDPVTWYKIIYTGEQVAQWDFQNNATRTSSPGPAFVLEVPLRNLLTSIYNFVPCDRIVQRAHSCRRRVVTLSYATKSYPVNRQRTTNKCTKIYNARAQLLFCSLNLLFGDVPVMLLSWFA